MKWAREHYPDIRDPGRLERVARAAYPQVDLLAEAKAALAWETADPKRGKVLHGKFLNAWWATAHKDARAAAPPAAQPEPRPPKADAGCTEWQELRDHIEAKLRPDLFDRWFSKLQASYSAGTLTLQAPDRYAAQFLDDNYREWLAGVAADRGRPLAVRFSAP